MTALLQTEGLTRHFRLPRTGLARRQPLHAVQEVSLGIELGEVVGLVGESGSGKSTLGRLVLCLLQPTAGRILFDGADITHARPRALRALRRQAQMIFQDPHASLNPRRRVGAAITEVLALHGIGPPRQRRDRAAELLHLVGLQAADMQRLPRDFSGGQRQRIAIARALAVQPRLLVADEPVSALDVSVQAGILALLATLRAATGMAILFIAHDLSVVEAIADRVVVLYLGRVMEDAPAASLFAAPRHPYTAALLAAAPGRAGRARLEAAGRNPLPRRAPFGLRLPHALPLRAARLRHHPAPPRRHRARPPHRVPAQRPAVLSRRWRHPGQLGFSGRYHAWFGRKSTK